jgi:hypothetical protein
MVPKGIGFRSSILLSLLTVMIAENGENLHVIANIIFITANIIINTDHIILHTTVAKTGAKELTNQADDSDDIFTKKIKISLSNSIKIERLNTLAYSTVPILIFCDISINELTRISKAFHLSR